MQECDYTVKVFQEAGLCTTLGVTDLISKNEEEDTCSETFSASPYSSHFFQEAS
jgi:hypothetical protein